MADQEAAVRFLASQAGLYQTKNFDENLSTLNLTREQLRTADAFTATKFLARFHAVTRGGMGSVYGPKNLAALDRVGELDSDRVWNAFLEECDKCDVGYNKSNQPIKGLVELAAQEGNPFQWIAQEVQEDGTIKPVYTELKHISGIGNKIASFIVRDAVWLMGVEKEVVPEQHHLLQAIDVWVGRAASLIWDEYTDTDPREKFREKARTIAEYCNSRSLSGIEFNQGAYYLGAQAVDGDQDQFKSTIRAKMQP